MTKEKIYRAYRKLFAKVTEGDGYQPFGYDVPTMKIIHPSFFPAVERLQKLLNKCFESEKDK